ncbi:MAG: ice-binding family protein [Myxococcota bacterium]
MTSWTPFLLATGAASMLLLSFPAACGESGFGTSTVPGLRSAAALQAASAQAEGRLGAAGSFAVLANTAVTCTDSTISGDVGIYSQNVPVTQTNCTINGSIHEGDALAIAAYDAFLAAYEALALEPCGEVLSGTLSGVILSPGVYCFDAAATLTGQLTLDGPSSGVWIFQVGTGGTGALTGTNFSVVTSGGAQACNVYWRVAEAATMTTSNFQGTILAGAATTFTGGSLIGRTMAQAAITLTGVTVSGCSPGTPAMACKDFVTGGGWIALPDGAKGTFGATGGIKHDELWGHLTYVDHGAKGSKGRDMKVKGTGVTAYTVIDAMTRHIEGTAAINGADGFTYALELVDNGEPGRGDMFALWLSNDYTASGYLVGGNIQLHKSCRPVACAPSEHRDDDGGDDHHERRDRHQHNE